MPGLSFKKQSRFYGEEASYVSLSVVRVICVLIVSAFHKAVPALSVKTLIRSDPKDHHGILSDGLYSLSKRMSMAFLIPL